MAGKSEIKKAVNRAGLIAVVVGVVSYIATGGEAGSLGDIVTLTASLAGTALILIREIMG